MLIKSKKTNFRFALLLILSFFILSSAHAADAVKGKEIFTNNCTSCHMLGSVLVGPDLTGVKSRWKDEAKLIAFVKNSQEVVKSGDSYASALFDKMNKVIMPPQPLTDDEIKDALEYANAGSSPQPEQAQAVVSTPQPTTMPNGDAGTPVPSPVNSETTSLGMSYTMSVIILATITVILLYVIYLLSRTRANVTRVQWEKEHPGEELPAGRWERIGEKWGKKWKGIFSGMNPYFVVSAIFGIFFVIWVWQWYDRAQDLGLQIGYGPEQPVKFSHRLHAGQYGIKCQYCHTGVEKSKEANIPSVNICMNCHKGIKSGPQYGKDEIAKVISAYENKRPIKWVRIHNLQDFVFFSHQQHVVAGKLQCENCHGKVQDMERVNQQTTLEMGWCVNCHRETKVHTENPYYAKTYDFIQSHKKYTVAQLGGLECARCHY